jgi:two-component system, sensor histidine kinase
VGESVDAVVGHSVRLMDLQRFEARNSANGLFLRYCGGRSRHFAPRQVMAIVAGLTFMMLEDAATGLVILALCLGGDAADSLLMHRIWRRYRNRTVSRGARVLVRLSGALQALTIAVSAALAWNISSDVRVEFYVTAFIVGAIINAGLARPYDPLSGDLKLCILAGVWALLILNEGVLTGDPAVWLSEHAFYVVASLMLAFSSFTFLRFIDDTFAKRRAIERDLLRNQLALEASQAALTQREAQARRLAVVAEQANDAVIICDRAGLIEWVNDTFTRITGYALDEARGQSPGVLLAAPASDSTTLQRIADARTDARPFRAEILNQTKLGRTIWMETSLTPVWNLDGTHGGTIHVERDITGAKEREAELARANAEAHAAAEARSRFLATMSHEIRTPMNGVIGMADLLSRTPLTDEQRDYLTAITDSGEALLSLINDILDLTKLQSGKMDIADLPFDIVATVHGVTTLLSPMAKAKGIALVECLPARAVWRGGDAGRVRQVLMNLIGNAVKFTQDGRVSVDLRMTAESATIAVSDTGIGIAADRIDHIFDAFTQADGAITRAFGGTGLGLTISRILSRAMGGDITVTSVAGQGSTFTLTLPLVAAVAPKAITADEGAVAWPPSHPIRVLMAEDNATNRLILSRMIAAPGVNLSAVENGALAVDSYAADPPDLIIMDMQMPVMDGLTAIRRIRVIERERGLRRCPVLVLTANAFREDESACLAADADAFQSKPVRRTILLQQAAALVGHALPATSSPARAGLA